MSVESASAHNDARVTTPAPAFRRRRGVRPVRLAGVLAGIALASLVGLFAVAWLPSVSSPQATGNDGPASVADGEDSSPDPGSITPAWERPAMDAGTLLDRIGVRVTSVAVSGGGGLIDLRIQVVDAEKAGALHDTATPPALVDEETGIVASSLLMGHSHTESFTAGLTYYYIFENPGNTFHRGDTVSVLLGASQLEHVDLK